MAQDCSAYVSAEDLVAAKESIVHIEHVATSKDAEGNPALEVTDEIRGVAVTNTTLDGLFSDIGFKSVNGSFEDGGTLVNRWDTLLYEADGSFYQWMGELPKTVPAGSSPFDAQGNLIAGWEDRSDLNLRTDLKSTNGSTLIGTNHRGTLQKDLDAIDRRPDGYAGGITDVLANGNDVEINKDYSISSRIDVEANQVVKGEGGVVTVTNTTAPAFFADGKSTGIAKDNIQIRDVRIQGSVVPEGGAAYGVFIRDGYRPVIDGLDGNGFTGSAIITGTKAAHISKVHCKESWYHPDLVAGGYGVLIGQSSEWILDGVQFYAENENNGRHLLYITSGTGTGVGDGLTNNVIATNLIGKYSNKNNRNMIPINMRQHNRRVLSNFVLDGANAGVSYFTENGAIQDGITTNGIVNAYKYEQGTPTYSISQAFVNGYGCNGFIESNLNIRVRLKSGVPGLTGVDTVAYKVAGTFQILSNILTQVPALGYPFIFEAGCNNILVSNVVDAVGSDDVSGATVSAMFRFLGPCSNIKITGIQTARPMFYAPGSAYGGLDKVTDMTVDYPRKARIVVSGGAATKNDSEFILGNITLNSTGMDIAMPSHVTQAAVEAAIVNCVGPYQAVITSYANKLLSIKTYTIAGAVLNPQTTAVVVNIILSS